MSSDDPILDPRFGPMPFISVANSDQLNLIPNAWRRVGMLAFTTEDTNYWQLLNPPWTGTDADWAAFCPCGPGTGYHNPAFTSFAIQGQKAVLEVGDTVPGGTQAFLWGTSFPANIRPHSIAIDDTTGGLNLATGLANTGSAALTIAAVTELAPATHTWTIQGANTQNAAFSRTAEVNWWDRVFAGTNANPELTANAIKALSDSANLQAGFAGTYTYADPGSAAYHYFCAPDVMGSPSSFVEASTGIPWSMATAADDPAYSNVAQGISYALVAVLNTFGVETTYRVYRTATSYSGAYTLAVS